MGHPCTPDSAYLAPTRSVPKGGEGDHCRFLRHFLGLLFQPGGSISQASQPISRLADIHQTAPQLPIGQAVPMAQAVTGRDAQLTAECAFAFPP